MTLKYKIDVNSANAENKLKKFNKGLKNSDSNTKALSKSLQFLSGAAVIGAAVKGFNAISNSIGEIAKKGDSFDKMSKRIGATTQFLSGFGHVAELAGTNIGSLENGFRRLTRNMKDADDGLKTAKEGFDELGIDIRDTAGKMKTVEAITMEAADALSVMDDETRKLALAQEIFGRSGAMMLPILNQGTEAIKLQMEEAKALGIVWDEMAAKTAADYIDAMTRIGAAWDGLKQKTILPLLKSITSALEQTAAAVSGGPGSLALQIEKAEHEVQNLKETIEATAADSIGNKLIGAMQKAFGEDVTAGPKADLTILNQMLAEAEQNLNNLTAQRDKLNKAQQTTLPVLPQTTAAKDKDKGNFDVKDTTVLDPVEAMRARVEARRLAHEAELEMIEAELDAEERKAQRQKELAEANKDMAMANASAVINQAQSVVSLFKDDSKEMFGLSKGLAIAQTTMNAYQSITKTLAQGGVFAIPAAIATGAFAFAQVAKIASTTFQKKRAGGTVMGAGSGTSDSVPTMLSKGETVIDSDTSRRNGGFNRIMGMLKGGQGKNDSTIIINNPIGTRDWFRDNLKPILNSEMARA